MVGPRPWGTALWITVSPVPGKYAFAQPGQGSNVPSRDYLAGYGGLAARQTPPAACPRPHGQGRPSSSSEAIVLGIELSLQVLSILSLEFLQG